MHKIVSLLPMKSYSERVPNKNIKNFSGSPLFHRIIESLINSKYIDKIAIDTDDEFIKSDAKEKFGDKVIIIDRPKYIQGDFVSMNEIIDYDLSQLDTYDVFLQTHSTNPLLTTLTIDKACEKYFNLENQFDSIFSVTRLQTRLYWENGRPLNHNPKELLRTQDLPIVYEENSNFYLFSRDSFFANGKKRIGERPFLFEIDKLEAIDIDDPEDFIIAEQLYKLKNHE